MREKVRETGAWILIAALSVALVVLYVDNYRTRNCIADYMVKDQQNTTLRAELAEGERAQFLLTMQVIFNPDSTSEQRRDAGESYIALVEANDVKRKKSPPLPVPTECD